MLVKETPPVKPDLDTTDTKRAKNFLLKQNPNFFQQILTANKGVRCDISNQGIDISASVKNTCQFKNRVISNKPTPNQPKKEDQIKFGDTRDNLLSNFIEYLNSPSPTTKKSVSPNVDHDFVENFFQPNTSISNPSSDKDTVIKEILNKNPETAFCFLNKSKIIERITLLKEHFLPSIPFRRIAYAVKANPRKEILEILGQEEIQSFDCASPVEIRDTLDVNPDAKILFNHPVKKEKDIRYATLREVKHFTVQTREEIQKVLRNISPFSLSNPVEMAVRLKTLNSKAKVNLSTKYGSTYDDAREILVEIKNQAGFASGLSIHTGSQNTNLNSFERGITLMTDLAREVGGVKTLNIGGGLPVNYFENEKVDIKNYLRYLSKIIEQNLPKNLDSEPEIIIEIGRSIIAEAIDLLIPVLSVEKRSGKKCVYFDDGVFTSFSDALVHGWKYNFKTRGNRSRKLSEKTTNSVLFGRTCDSGDVLGEVSLPEDIQRGDYIHIENAGAYMDSQTTYFNGFEPPQYVIYN